MSDQQGTATALDEWKDACERAEAQRDRLAEALRHYAQEGIKTNAIARAALSEIEQAASNDGEATV